MSKVVDGVELLRMVRDYEIKDKSKIIVYYKTNKHYEFHYECNMLLDKENKEVIYDFNGGFFIDKDYKFEILLEKDEEIDIDRIEELDEEVAREEDCVNIGWTHSEQKIVKQQNIILKAVKQLNKINKKGE